MTRTGIVDLCPVCVADGGRPPPPPPDDIICTMITLSKPGQVTGVATMQLRRRLFALFPSLGVGHFPPFAREATMFENTPACSTGVLTCYTDCTTCPRSVRNTSTTTPRGTKVLSRLLPTKAQTARMTRMGCSTLPWTCTRTISYCQASDVLARVVRQAQKRTLRRPSHRQMPRR